MNQDLSVGGRAAEMRAAFDRGFAEPLSLDVTVRENLLAIEVGTESCAIRLSDVTGLFVGKKITRVPGGDASLIGIAGFRGAIVPVYGLRTLLGQSGDPSAAAAPRWLVVAKAAPVALAFDGFAGQLRVLPDAILPRQARAETRSYIRDFVQTQAPAVQTQVLPILHLPSILDAIKAPRAEAAPAKER